MKATAWPTSSNRNLLHRAGRVAWAVQPLWSAASATSRREWSVMAGFALQQWPAGQGFMAAPADQTALQHQLRGRPAQGWERLLDHFGNGAVQRQMGQPGALLSRQAALLHCRCQPLLELAGGGQDVAAQQHGRAPRPRGPRLARRSKERGSAGAGSTDSAAAASAASRASDRPAKSPTKNRVTW